MKVYPFTSKAEAFRGVDETAERDSESTCQCIFNGVGLQDLILQELGFVLQNDTSTYIVASGDKGVILAFMEKPRLPRKASFTEY